MSLFGKKKEEEKKAPACACNSGCPASEVTEITSNCCPEAQNGVCCIKVLGSGCASCHYTRTQRKPFKKWGFR